MVKRDRRLFLVLFGAALCFGHAVCLQLTEVFRDDFNGNYVDGSKWNLVNRASEVNSELEYYLPDEISLQNGTAVIRSQQRSSGGRSYTSGRMDTLNKFSFLYGEVEWRAKLPKGQGIWPALWLLTTKCPAATPCDDWPPEIDVMEARGDLTTKIATTLHYGKYPNNSFATFEYFGPDFTADFHSFKTSWDSDKVVFYVDNLEVFRVTVASEIPREELYVIMNTAVGGTYSGNPDSTTTFPVNFVIDWVSVRQWK